MSHETKPLANQFLVDPANAEEPVGASTMEGYRSLGRRLPRFCPRLPVSMMAFKRFLDDAGKGTLGTVRRRYDFANRFFKSELVQGLGIPNPCDRIARPGKIVIAAVRETGQDAGGAASPATAAPAAVPQPAVEAKTAEVPVAATQEVVDRYLELCRLDNARVEHAQNVRAHTASTGGSLPHAAAERRPGLLRTGRSHGLQAEHAPSAPRRPARTLQFRNVPGPGTP